MMKDEIQCSKIKTKKTQCFELYTEKLEKLEANKESLGNLLVGIDLVSDEKGFPYCAFVARPFLDFVLDMRKQEGQERFGMRIHGAENIQFFSGNNPAYRLSVAHLYIVFLALHYIADTLAEIKDDGSKHSSGIVRLGHGIGFWMLHQKPVDQARKSGILHQITAENIFELQIPFEICSTSNRFLLFPGDNPVLIDDFHTKTRPVLGSDNLGIWRTRCSCPAQTHQSVDAEYCLVLKALQGKGKPQDDRPYGFNSYHTLNVMRQQAECVRFGPLPSPDRSSPKPMSSSDPKPIPVFSNNYIILPSDEKLLDPEPDLDENNLNEWRQRQVWHKQLAKGLQQRETEEQQRETLEQQRETVEHQTVLLKAFPTSDGQAIVKFRRNVIDLIYAMTRAKGDQTVCVTVKGKDVLLSPLTLNSLSGRDLCEILNRSEVRAAVVGKNVRIFCYDIDREKENWKVMHELLGEISIHIEIYTNSLKHKYLPDLEFNEVKSSMQINRHANQRKRLGVIQTDISNDNEDTSTLGEDMNPLGEPELKIYPVCAHTALCVELISYATTLKKLHPSVRDANDIFKRQFKRKQPDDDPSYRGRSLRKR